MASDLDAVVARSRTARGTRRRFSLARRQAIEKMREFTLRHPRQYVLELVQSAVFAGARWIAIDVHDDSLLFAWVGGEPFSRKHLETLFDHLFADQGRREVRHVQQLAVAANAILQRRPTELLVESGDGTLAGTLRAAIHADATVSVSAAAAPLAGTWLRARFSRGWLDRFRRADGAERDLVLERCLYTPVPILLDGRAPFGRTPNRAIQVFGLDDVVTIDSDGRRGALGIARPGVAPRIRWVVGGVWVSERRVPELGDQTGGVLADDRLRKTADMSDIVLDDRYAALLRAVQPAILPVLERRHARVSTDVFRPPRVLDPPGSDGLPDPLPQAGPRPDLHMQDLERLDPALPLFRIAPDADWAADPALDPATFPWPVLVLTDGQARAASERLGGRPIGRLTRAEDARFVREMLAQRDDVRAVLSAGVASPRGPATVRVAVHLVGPTPRVGGGSGSPVAIRVDGTTRAVRHAQPELPGVTAVVDLPEGTPADAEAIAWALRAVLDTAPLLLHELPPDHDTSLGIAATLVATLARPHLYRREGRVAIELHLPDPLADVDILTRPIARTPEGLASTADLVARLGTADVLRVATAADVARLRPLEARLGFGHVAHPSIDGAALALVGRVHGQWMWLGDTPGWTEDAVSDVIALGSTLAPEVAMSGMVAASPPVPGVCHLVRDGAEPADPWPGLLFLKSRLQMADAEGRWADLVPGVDTERLMGLGRLAIARIAHEAGTTDQVVLTSAAGRRRTIGELREDPHFAVYAHGGPHVAEAGAVPLTRDQLALLWPDDDAPLRFDDPLSVWRALDAPTGWVLRVPVAGPGVRGWLGLRRPHDPTPGVLVEVHHQLTAAPGVDRRWPCHGLVTADEPTTPVGPPLDLAAQRLYADLADHLAAHPDDADALAYARAVVQRPHRRSALVRALADAVGEPIPPPAAPAPPGPSWVRALADRLATVTRDLPAPLWVPDARLSRVPCVVHRGSPVTIDLDVRHPLVARAQAGEPRATDTLVLEILRQWERATAEVSLLDAGARLLATR